MLALHTTAIKQIWGKPLKPFQNYSWSRHFPLNILRTVHGWLMNKLKTSLIGRSSYLWDEILQEGYFKPKRLKLFTLLSHPIKLWNSLQLCNVEFLKYYLHNCATLLTTDVTIRRIRIVLKLDTSMLIGT